MRHILIDLVNYNVAKQISLRPGQETNRFFHKLIKPDNVVVDGVVVDGVVADDVAAVATQQRTKIKCKKLAVPLKVRILNQLNLTHRI